MQNSQRPKKFCERNAFFIFYLVDYILGAFFAESLKWCYVFFCQCKNVRRIGDQPFILKTSKNFGTQFINFKNGNEVFQIPFVFCRTFFVRTIISHRNIFFGAPENRGPFEEELSVSPIIFFSIFPPQAGQTSGILNFFSLPVRILVSTSTTFGITSPAFSITTVSPIRKSKRSI